MNRFRLSRRSVLRGMGSIAITLPWLELMHDERSARAAVTPARRFLAVFSPGGTVHNDTNGVDRWTPTGTETNFTLSPILQPLLPVQKNLIVPTGIDMKSAVGEQQQSGMVAWLSGTNQAVSSNGVLGFAGGPSIDQVLARTLSSGKPKASIQMAVRWGTGKSHGLVSPIDIVNFADDAAFTPIPPALDPVAIWNDLFGAVNPAGGNARAWDQSILDYLDTSYSRLSARIGTADKQRVDEHLSRIRELEKNLASIATSGCAAPPLVDTSDYDPKAGLGSSNDGSAIAPVTDAAIPKVGKFMIDMMVMALACDRTGVGTLQWNDSEMKHTYPWLNLKQNQTLAFYQSDGGYQPNECATIGTWYCQQHSYLLQQMAAVDMGFHSLLDESVVFFGSQLSEPPTHKKLNMPFLLAGGGGGLRGGRFLQYGGASHNDLLVSILNLCGDDRSTFGDPRFCTGPLPNLA